MHIFNPSWPHLSLVNSQIYGDKFFKVQQLTKCYRDGFMISKVGVERVLGPHRYGWHVYVKYITLLMHIHLYLKLIISLRMC